MYDLVAIATFHNLALEQSLKKKKQTPTSYSQINESYDLGRAHYILCMHPLQPWLFTVFLKIPQ